jgi:hypothetical protein
MAEERRQTERAINYWLRHFEQFHLSSFGLIGLETQCLIADDGDNRFVIGVDYIAGDHLLLDYGRNFARLLGFREISGSCVRMIHEIPDKAMPVFIRGLHDAATTGSPVRIEGEIDLGGRRRQLYRTAFMPIGGNLVFGAFNCCLVGRRRRLRTGDTRMIGYDASSDEAAIAAFIRLRGVTRCPTAYAGPTRASITAIDRAALERYMADRERQRQQRRQRAAWDASFWRPRT